MAWLRGSSADTVPGSAGGTLQSPDRNLCGLTPRVADFLQFGRCRQAVTCNYEIVVLLDLHENCTMLHVNGDDIEFEGVLKFLETAIGQLNGDVTTNIRTPR
jgi:hypothetical protein